MFNQNAPADPAIHESAVRAAFACRRIIQCLLREEEWRDADWEFYRVIRGELEAFMGVSREGAKASSPETTHCP